MHSPMAAGWYYAKVRIHNPHMDHRCTAVEFMTRLWFNPDAIDKWWLGDDPSKCAALHKAIHGASVVAWL